MATYRETPVEYLVVVCDKCGVTEKYDAEMILFEKEFIIDRGWTLVEFFSMKHQGNSILCEGCALEASEVLGYWED